MAYYNPYKNDEKKKDNTSTNWFFNTGIKAALLGLNAFAIYGLYKKAKGPFVSSLERLANIRTKKIIAREYKKSSTQSEFEDSKRLMREHQIDVLDQNISDEEYDKIKSSSSFTRNKIEQLEIQLATAGQIEDPTILSTKIVGSDLATDVLKKKQVDSIFTRLRYESLKMYIERWGSETRGDLSRLTSYSDDFLANKDAINNLHQHYMQYSAYADEIYSIKLRNLKSAHFLDAKGKMKSRGDIQSSLYNRVTNFYSNFLKDSITPSINITANDVPDIYGEDLRSQRGGLMKIDSRPLHELMDKNSNELSASTGIHRTTSEILKVPLAVRYDKDLKELIKVLDDIIKDPDRKIGDYKITYDTYATGPKQGHVNYVNVILNPSDPEVKGNIEFRLPITKDYLMPGSTPTSTQVIDGMFINTSPIETVDGLKDQNGAQRIIHKVIKLLRSSTLTKDNKENIQRSIYTAISETRIFLPLNSFEIRDHLVKATAVYHPWVEEFVFNVRKKKFLKERLLHSLNSLKALKRLTNHKNAVIISVDYEAISTKNIGVQHTPGDPDTHVYKAGVTVADHNGVVKSGDNFEFVSTHCLDKLKGKITPKVKELFARWQGESDPELAWKNFVTSLEKESETIGTNAKDNTEFNRIIYEKLSRLKTKYISEGKEVFFNFKNGWQYDIKFLHQVGDFALENKENIIDVQNIMFVRNIAENSTQSAAMESAIKNVLLKIHPGDSDVAAFVNSQGKMDAKKLLKYLAKPSSLLKSAGLKSLLQMNDVDIEGFGSRLHMAPKTDSLIAMALTRFESISYLLEEGMYGQGDFELIQELLGYSQRPLTTIDIVELSRKITATPLAGHKAYRASTSTGTRARLKGSMAQPGDMMNEGHEANRYGEHLHRSYPLGPSQRYYKQAKQSNWNMVKHFMPPILSQPVLETERRLKADAYANYYSHYLVAKTAAVTGNAYGPENFFALSQKFMSGVGTQFDEKIRITPELLDRDSQVTHQVMEFYRRVLSEAKKIAGDNGYMDNDTWSAANRMVRDEEDKSAQLRIKPNMKTPGGRVSNLHGKIVWVDHEFGGVNRTSKLPTIVASIVRYAEGDSIARTNPTAISYASKSQVTFSNHLTRAMASDNKHGLNAIVKFDSLDKGFVGWYKAGFMNRVIRHWQEIYNDESLSKSVRADALRNIRKIARRLQGRVDTSKSHFGYGTIIPKPAEERKNLLFQNLTKEQSEFAQMYTGGIDLSMREVAGYMIDAGMVHDQQSSNMWNETMLQGKEDSDSLKVFDQAIENISKGVVDKKIDKLGILQNLTEDGKTSVIEDIQYMRKMAAGNVGAASMFEMLHQNIGGVSTYVPGSVIVNVIALANIDSGLQARKGIIKLQRNYFTDIFTNIQKDHTTYQYIMNNMNARKNRKYAEQFRAWMAYRDLMINKAMVNGGVSLEALNILLPEGDTRAVNASKTALNSTSSVQGQQIIDAANANASLTLAEREHKANSRIAAAKMATGDLSEPLTNKGRKFTLDQVDEITQLVRSVGKNGIVSLDLGIKETNAKSVSFVIPLEQTLRKIGSIGHYSYSNGSLNKAIDKMVGMFAAAQDKTSKSWFRIEGEGAERKLHLDMIPLFMLPNNQGNFTSAPGDTLLRPTKDMKFSLDVVNAFRYYSEAMTSKDHRTGKVDEDLVEGSAQILRQNILRMLLLGNSAAKGSANFDMAQVHFNGEWASHGNFESLAGTLINMGEPSDDYLKSFKNSKIKDFKAFRNFRSRMLKGRRDTIYMTQTLFKKTLQGQLGDAQMNLKDFEDSVKGWNNIKKGEGTLPGGLFARFPMNQSGADALLPGQIQLIPDEYAGLIGANHNTIYTHSIYSTNVGADVDADQIALLLKLNAITQNMFQVNAEKEEDYLVFHNRDDMKAKLNKFQISNTKEKLEIGEQVRLAGFVNKQVVLTGYDSNGNFEVINKDITDSSLDFTGIFSKIAGISAKSGAHMAKNLTGANISMLERFETAPIVMKKLIGEVTNIAKSRALMALGADVRRSPQGKIDPLLATLTTDFSGLGQVVIDSGKHGEAAAEMATMAMNFFRDTDRHFNDYDKVKNFWLDMTRKSVGEQIDPKTGLTPWNRILGSGEVGTGMTLGELAEVRFDLLAGRYKSLDEASKHNKALKMHMDATNNAMFGKDQTNLSDLIVSTLPEIDPAINELFLPRDNAPHSNIIDPSNLLDRMSRKFKEGPAAIFRKGSAAKYGAIGAVAFLGLNLFRPNQLSNSLNPLDAFIGLDKNVNGDQNAISSELELDRSIPLDRINASFSKEAYIRLNKTMGGTDNKIKGGILQGMMANAFQQMGQQVMNITNNPTVNYSNYTTFVGNFGTPSLQSRANR